LTFRRCRDLSQRSKLSRGKGVAMQVQTVEPDASTGEWLAGAQFRDAFSVVVDGTALDARHAAEKMLGRSPRWIEGLLALRNFLVSPFGLKKPVSTGTATTDTIGIFPVVSEAPGRLVAGLNDKHLDFRVVVDIAPFGHGQRVTATTLVLTHNRLGRAYLAVIWPFHWLVVRALLRQVAA
jgi:hypothetical protein